jgi:hypothetical protein
VLDKDVPQHCLSGQRSWVSDPSLKLLHALCVSAGKTEEGRAPIVSTDAVHHSYSVHEVFGSSVINFTSWIIVTLIRCCTDAPHLIANEA